MRSVPYAGYVAAIRNAVRSTFRRFCDWLRKPRWFPSDLAVSRLVFAERSFSIRHPINLVARIDRAYDDGSALALLELKTRLGNRIFMSDIIELSAQRLAVQLATHHRVHEYGFILLLNPETRRKSMHKVSLYPQVEVVAIARRRRLVMAGVVGPRDPVDAACCRCCEYLAECSSDTT